MKKILVFLILLCQTNIIYTADKVKEEAQLIYYEGKVETKREQKKEWKDVKLKMMFYPKDRIRTRLQSKAELKLPDNSIFSIGENTTFEIQKLFTDNKSNTRKFLFKLFSGDLVGKIEKLRKGDTFEIETPVALVGFRGTTVFMHVELNGETWIGMKSGSGYTRSIKTGAEKAILENNYLLMSTEGAFIGSGILSGSDLKRFEDLEKAGGELIKEGGITPPKILSVEKEKEAVNIKGKADPGHTINMISSIGKSMTTKSDESGNFSFIVKIGEDKSPPVIKITTSEFGKRATNKRNIKIAGIVTDGYMGKINFIFISVNKDGEKSIQTAYKLDILKEKLRFYVNNRRLHLSSGIINTSYMLNEGKNILEFRAVDGAENESKETRIVYLDTRAPHLISFNISPNPANMYDFVEILIEAEDEYSKMKKNLTLELFNRRGNSYQMVMPYDYTTKKYRIRMSVNKILGKRAEGNWKISVKLEDELGNRSMKYFREFMVIDLPPPPPNERR